MEVLQDYLHRWYGTVTCCITYVCGMELCHIVFMYVGGMELCHVAVRRPTEGDARSHEQRTTSLRQVVKSVHTQTTILYSVCLS